jgi:hypothetical protein
MLYLMIGMCNNCGQVFSSEIKLQTHVLDYHREEADVEDISNPGNYI